MENNIENNLNSQVEESAIQAEEVTAAPQETLAEVSQPVQTVSASQPSEPGKGLATASLVLGIISVVTWFLGSFAFVGLVTGIVGLVCASKSKKQGFNGGIRTAGFVLSIIGLVGSAIVCVACVACVGLLGTAGVLDSL